MNNKMERVPCEQTVQVLFEKKVIDNMKFIINKSGISVGGKVLCIKKGFSVLNTKVRGGYS